MNSTSLEDRILYYDGDSVIPASLVTKLLLSGKSIDGLFVDHITPDIEQYNRHVPSSKKIRTKSESTITLNFDWNLPQKYLDLDIKQYIHDKLLVECEKMENMEKITERLNRTQKELALYQQMNLFSVLRALIFIINTLQEHKVCWGIGRGSGVSSYVLYLIGVHDVDSVEYELDIRDFLKPS